MRPLQIAVATFYGPAVMRAKEGLEGISNRVRTTLQADLSGLPDNGVEVEMGEAVVFCELLCEGAFARARISKDERFHCSVISLVGQASFSV